MVIDCTSGACRTFPVDEIKPTVADAPSIREDLVLLANRQTDIGQGLAQSIPYLADATI